MASGPITSLEIDGETVETVSDFISWGSKITADGDCSHEIKKRLLLGRKVMTNLDRILKAETLFAKKGLSSQSYLLLLVNAGDSREKSLIPSLENSGLISFRMVWLDLLAVQGTLKNLLNTTFQKHPFFGTQPSLWSTLTSTHDYWKNHNFD